MGRTQYQRWLRRGAIGFVMGLGLYLGSALLVFDFSASAPHGELGRIGDGRRVAAGPRPRYPFDRGANVDLPGGWDYSGKERVFQIYRPVVSLYLLATNQVSIASAEAEIAARSSDG